MILNYEPWYVVKRRDDAILHAHRFRGKAKGNSYTIQGAIVETQEPRRQNSADLSLGHSVDLQQPTEVRQAAIVP